MTNKISIQPSTLELGSTWVHLQNPRSTPITFEIVVPNADVEEVFGPTSERGSLSVSTFVKHQIDKLGTFIVEGYFDSIRKLMGKKKKSPYRWVITSIDDVRENCGDITLVGKFVEFDTSKYR